MKLPSLGMIKQSYGELSALSYLKIWIIGVSEFTNVGNNLKESQIDKTCMYILEDYQHLTITELALVFKRAEKGFYGQLFNRLDGQVILGWFLEYEKERTKNIVPR